MTANLSFFIFFQKIENFWKCFAKISVTKFGKLKMTNLLSKQVILFRNFLHEKCINRKNKVHHNEEHGKTKKMAVSIFFRRPPESGLILHRSCVIYDGCRLPETGHVTRSWLLIGQPPLQPQEKVVVMSTVGRHFWPCKGLVCTRLTTLAGCYNRNLRSRLASWESRIVIDSLGTHILFSPKNKLLAQNKEKHSNIAAFNGKFSR